MLRKKLKELLKSCLIAAILGVTWVTIMDFDINKSLTTKALQTKYDLAAEEYLNRIAAEDWSAAITMMGSEESWRLAQAEWEQLQKEQGAILSWTFSSFYRRVFVVEGRHDRPSLLGLYTEYRVSYKLQYEKGTADVTLILQSRLWPTWKVWHVEIEDES